MCSRGQISSAYFVSPDATLCSDIFISYSFTISDMITEGFYILLQHPCEVSNLYPCVFSVKRVYVCVQVCGCTFGCVRSCALSRCAGMAVCCNASCFANGRRSREGCDICLRGCLVEKRVDKDTVASTKSKTMSHLTG